MPDLDGVELLRRLNQLRKDIPVNVITGHGDVPLAVETMKLGAADFLEKPFDDQALLMAVRAALGRRQQTAEADRHKSEIRARLATLSVREEQVLRGLVAGHANKAIAFDLGISARTVEVYRANVMSKMQANSLSELVRMALLAAPDTMGHPN
jgi:two-component system response regulator FixJ